MKVREPTLTKLEEAANVSLVDAEALSGLAGFEQDHLTSYMQLADAKAAVFLAVASGAVAYIASHYGLAWLQEEHFLGHSLLLSLTTLTLVVSAAFDVAVIVPRTRWRDAGHMYFLSVARYHTAEAYADFYLKMSQSEIAREQLLYIHALAKICERKYRVLNVSLVLGLLGYAMFLALLFWR